MQYHSRFNSAAKSLFRIGLFTLFLFATLVQPEPLESANLVSVSNTLQSARLSWGARVEADGTDEGASRVQIQSAPATPLNSTSTANLHSGDTVLINANSYTVVDIIDADEFSVTPVVQSGDADDGDPIYMEMKPRHVITFDTATAVPNGYFRVLIAADATGDNDGNIDDDGFDFGGGGLNSVDVVAADVGNYDFVTGVSTDSGSTGCTSPANYHCFEAHYSGNGGIGTTVTINIGNTNGTNSLISPGETSSHTEATADTLFYQVRNYSASNVLIDSSTGVIALIEAVRVTATVDPTITFTIAGVDTGTSICGATPDIDTTTGVNSPLAVPFGSLSLNTFVDAGHNLTLSTNADGGAAVTAVEDDQLGKDGATSPFIPDSTGDGAAMTHAVEEDWATATNNGFAYALHDSDTDVTEAFAYNSSSTGSCTVGTFCARQFPAAADTESPAEIFNTGGTVANAVDLYVCYRISVGATQESGDYENIITYTATATF